MKTYIINLRRQPERRAFMSSQLMEQGFRQGDISWIDAVDATLFRRLPLGYQPHSVSKPYWELTESEVACFESHRLAWHAVIASGSAYGIVMEDDVLLQKDFEAIVSRALQNVGYFDVVKLDYSPGMRLFSNGFEVNGTRFFSVWDALPSAACYAISAKCCRRLLRESEVYCDHLDEFIWSRRTGYVAYQLAEAIAIQGMFCESAGVGFDLPAFIVTSLRTLQESNRKTRRGPVYYRLRKEINRLKRRYRVRRTKNGSKSGVIYERIAPPNA